MRELIRNNLKYIIFLAVFGLVGGYFTTLYTMQTLSEDAIEQTVSQIGSLELVIAISTLQPFVYTLILGILGKVLAKKIGLWHNITFNKKGNIELLLISVIGGAAFILLDVLFFANYSDVIKSSYEIKPSREYLISTATYGAVVEEIMLRLFFMSLIAFVIQKIAKKEEMNKKILIVANVVSAILFAAGHLPATFMSMTVMPMIIFRCFLLNGGFGLVFGRLYRKYGIHYAMLAHGGVHIISKLIWILFI